jgi:hypothetical protein
MVPRHVRSSEAVPVTTAEAESSTLVGRPSSGTPLDFDALWRALPELRRRYREATPFPHVVLDDFLDCSAAARAAREFPTIEKFGWVN